MDLTAYSVLHILTWLFGTKAAYDLRREFDFKDPTWFLIFWSVLYCLAMEAALLAAKAVPGLAVFAALAGITAGILTWLGFRNLQEDLCQVRVRARNGGRADLGAVAFSCAVLAGSLTAGILWPEATMRLAQTIQPAVGTVWFVASGALVMSLTWKTCPSTQAEIYRPATLVLGFLFAFLHSSLPFLAVLTGLDIPEEAGSFLSTLFILTLSVKLYGMVIRVRSHKLAQALLELHTLQEHLFDLEKIAAVGAVAAGAAHDFNNSIAVIIGFCDPILSDESISSQSREHVEIIRKQAWAAAAIGSQLMGLARRQISKNSYDTLREAVGIPLELLAKDFKRHRIEVVQRLEETPPVAVDLTLVSQVCLNLYLNARDAMKPMGQGRLEVSLRAAEGAVEISIADTGPGIPEEFQPKVFQPFQSTKGDKGTGLGLSMSRSVIEGMGGVIGFDSKTGAGARFWVRLPASPRA